MSVKTLYQQQKENPPEIINSIEKYLENDIKQNALEFVGYCKANKLSIRLGATYQWYVYFKNKHIATIGIRFIGMRNGSIGTKVAINENSCSIVLYLDIGNPVYENFVKTENLAEIIWKNVKHCEGCISCAPGREKIIIGKSFNNVCIGNSIRFANPDAESLSCIIKLLEFKKYLITTGNS